MSKFEKFMNILFKICGVIYLINFARYLLDYYHPTEINIAGNMFIIGIFCMLARWSKPSKEENYESN